MSFGGLSPAFGVAVTDSHVYVGTESGLLRVPKSFTGAPQTLHSYAAQILKADSKLYFGSSLGLGGVSLDGKSTFTWAVIPPFADVLAGNEQFLFFTTDLDGRLYRLRK